MFSKTVVSYLEDCSDRNGFAPCKHSETCIRQDQVCDGNIDCPTASDEIFDSCQNSERPMFALAFHCTNIDTRDMYQEKLCHPLCKIQPEICFYAMMTVQEQPEGTCKLPAWPEHGKYELTEGRSYSEFSLYYECDVGFELYGKNYPTCHDGEWEVLPWCIELSGWQLDEEDIRK
ncbi:SCO-spondin-like [Leguminivora glycinivorella]|uniref:SCO-spondin-like n=1 Tax=Leguminivora glycinivorella TaxID=1035111 RepID=UPI00200E9B09|nr:SCO-spondin-like [Leguminivora glycinivorella]